MNGYRLRGRWPMVETTTGPLKPRDTVHDASLEVLRDLAANWSAQGATCFIMVRGLPTVIERWEEGERV